MTKILQFPCRPTPTPTPNNGEVYATPSYLCRYVNGEEEEVWEGFAVVHMSRSGDSASITRGFATLAEAEAAALRIARECNAVLA